MRLGTDPEVFIVNPDGKLLSAIGMIGASKWEPLQINDMPKGFTLQEDNVALEYGIPPASSADEYFNSIQAVMNKSKEWIPQGCSFSKLSCAIFPEDQMNTAAAFVFGCEPDYNAWTGEANPPPQPPHPFMRSAGGHIHVETKKNKILVVKAMDLFLGVPSVLMDNGEERKKLYGKPGAYRPKTYGVEYRTLSNFWIFEKKYVEWVWYSTERALQNLHLADKYKDTILNVINNNDKKAAEKLVNELSLSVV